ncbi:PilZ domain-containing protein [Alsobacter sp. R-9]
MGRDARRHPRTRTLLSGLFVCPRGLLSPVAVVDLSEAGARIRHAGPLPPRFVLLIPTRRLAVEVALRWSDGDDHGVSFVAERAALAATAAARHARDRESTLWEKLMAQSRGSGATKG